MPDDFTLLMLLGLESVNTHSKNKIGENDVDIILERKLKFIVRCSPPPHDLKFDHFTLLSRRDWCSCSCHLCPCLRSLLSG